MSGGTNTTQQTLPNWLQPYLTTELGAASGITPGLGTPSQTVTLPNGQTMTIPGTQAPSASSLVAPMNATQQQGLSSMISAANNPANPTGSAANANAWETSGALLNPASNPYLQDTFKLAANSVQNQLDSQFAGAGSNVINSLPVQSDEMNNLATQLYGGAYQQGLNTMTQASALAPTIEQGSFLPGQELYSAGNIQQQQQQNIINAPYNALSWYSGLLGLNGSSLGGSSQSNNPNAALQDAGLGLGALGAFAEIAPLFAASDRRLKEEVHRVGTLRSGLPVYSFRYTFDAQKRRHIGVMADEAEKMFPDAVQWHEGYQYVDYSKIH